MRSERSCSGGRLSKWWSWNAECLRDEEDGDDGDDGMDSLRSRAAAHLLEICGGAASQGDNSRFLKACMVFSTKYDPAFPAMKICADVMLDHVFQDLFGVECQFRKQQKTLEEEENADAVVDECGGDQSFSDDD